MRLKQRPSQPDLLRLPNPALPHRQLIPIAHLRRLQHTAPRVNGSVLIFSKTALACMRKTERTARDWWEPQSGSDKRVGPKRVPKSVAYFRLSDPAARSSARAPAR